MSEHRTEDRRHFMSGQRMDLPAHSLARLDDLLLPKTWATLHPSIKSEEIKSLLFNQITSLARQWPAHASKDIDPNLMVEWVQSLESLQTEFRGEAAQLRRKGEAGDRRAAAAQQPLFDKTLATSLRHAEAIHGTLVRMAKHPVRSDPLLLGQAFKRDGADHPAWEHFPAVRAYAPTALEYGLFCRMNDQLVEAQTFGIGVRSKESDLYRHYNAKVQSAIRQYYDFGGRIRQQLPQLHGQLRTAQRHRPDYREVAAIIEGPQDSARSEGTQGWAERYKKAYHNKLDGLWDEERAAIRERLKAGPTASDGNPLWQTSESLEAIRLNQLARVAECLRDELSGQLHMSQSHPFANPNVQGSSNSAVVTELLRRTRKNASGQAR